MMIFRSREKGISVKLTLGDAKTLVGAFEEKVDDGIVYGVGFNENSDKNAHIKKQYPELLGTDLSKIPGDMLSIMFTNPDSVDVVIEHLLFVKERLLNNDKQKTEA